MGSRGAFRAAAFAAACLAFAFIGCTQIFGFESPVVAHCLLSSDCLDTQYPICRTNVCTPECRADVDCDDFLNRPTCIDNSCVATPAKVSVPDSDAEVKPPRGGMDGTSTDVGEARQDAEPTQDVLAESSCGDTLTDPNNCGHCATGSDAGGCASGVCENGVCDVLQTVGYTCTADQNGNVRIDVTAGMLGATKVFFPVGGWVTEIGLESSYQGASQQVRAAIYDDWNGAPRDRIGPAVALDTIGGKQVASVPHTVAEHTVLVAGTSYWLVAVSDAILAFEACPANPPGAPFALGPFPFSDLPTTITTQVNVGSQAYAPSFFVQLATAP